MIIAEATTKSGKLVQVEQDPNHGIKYHYVYVNGSLVFSSWRLGPSRSRFFQACQEGCNNV